VNANAARLGHVRRESLAPCVLDSPPLTGTAPPLDGERCPDTLPGTDMRCQERHHADGVACHWAGVRDGVFVTAFWWRVS
jgi:hypothetical protein